MESGKKLAEAEIVERGGTALLRIEDWDDTRTAKYRVRHEAGTAYEGTIRKNPVDKENFAMAGFTGNSIYPGHGGTIAKDDIISNIKKIDPDLLFSLEIKSTTIKTTTLTGCVSDVNSDP